MDKVKIGFPIEYEYDGIIYDGLFLREPEIKELKKRLKEINRIIDLKQQVKIQKEVINKAIECLDLWQIPECDKETMREIQFSANKQNILDILNEVSE